MASRKLIVEIVGDDKSLSRAFARSEKGTQRFSVGIGTIVKSAAVFGVVQRGMDAVSGAIRTASDEWQEQVKVVAQTNAVLKSTRGIANVTAAGVGKLAGRIARLSGIDDELIAKGENLILTFKNIRNEAGKGNRIFDRATKSAVNLSVAGFGAIESTAKFLGKALNDPVRGLTALTRAGVTFTQKQKDTIKGLVDSNRLLAAQKIVLREIESQVGGSAKALGETLPGQLARARESIKNVLGGLVESVTPALTATLGGLNRFIDRLAAARTVRAKLNVVFDTGKSLAEQALRIGTEVRERVSAVLAQIDWRQVGRTVGDALARALDEVADFVARVDWGQVGQSVVRGISDFLKGVNWIGVLKAMGILIVRAIIALDTLLFNASKELGRQILLGIVAGVRTLGGLVVNEVKKIPDRLVDLRDLFATKARGLGRAIIGGIGRGLDSAKDAILRKLLQLVDKILGVTGFLGRFDPFKGVRESVKKRLEQMEGDIKSSVGRIQKTIGGVKWKDVIIRVGEEGTSAVQRAIDGIKGKDVLIRIRTVIERATTIIERGATTGQSGRAQGHQAAVTAAEKAAGEEEAAAERIKAARQAAARAAKRAAVQAAKAKEAAIEAFAQLMDSLSFVFDRAGATKTLHDDLKVLREQEAAIREQVKIEGRTTDLERQLFQIEQQRADIRKQIAAQRVQQRQGRQFEALGLTTTGEARVPGVAALTKRLGTLKKQVQGTFLDTSKTSSELARIAKVLSGQFGKVGRDVRAAILEMLNNISSALSGEGGQKGPLTKFRKRGVEKLIEGLGLTEQQVKELRRRMSQMGAGGSVPGKGIGAFGMALPAAAGVGGGPLVVHTHIHLDGRELAVSTTRHQQKQRGRGAAQRRGVRPGI